MDLPEILLALDEAFTDIAHAFGGALALAWCTEDPRGTSDVDLNLFVPAASAEQVLATLPREIAVSKRQRDLLVRDGQVRLFWGLTPVDLFLNTTPFHEEAAVRVQTRTFGGRPVPFLSCSDLAVFKAFFDRPKDWVDIQDMLAARSVDAATVLGVLSEYLGADDPRVTRLRDLMGPDALGG